MVLQVLEHFDTLAEVSKALRPHTTVSAPA